MKEWPYADGYKIGSAAPDDSGKCLSLYGFTYKGGTITDEEGLKHILPLATESGFTDYIKIGTRDIGGKRFDIFCW